MRGGIAQGAVHRHSGRQDNACIRLTDNVAAHDGLCLTTLDRRRQGLKGGVSRQATGFGPFFFAGLDPLFLAPGLRCPIRSGMTEKVRWECAGQKALVTERRGRVATEDMRHQAQCEALTRL